MVEGTEKREGKKRVRHEENTRLCTTAVVPNHRAIDWYWFVGLLVPGHRERIKKLLYFCYIDNHTLKVVLP